MHRTLSVLRSLLLTALACHALPDAAMAQSGDKRPFAISHLYDIRDVSDPQCSPDGSRVAFVVGENSLADATSNSDLYVRTLDGKRMTRMTSDRASDSSPRWSPDGSQMLFISTRSGSAQAWVLPADGGEPRQITKFEQGVGDITWMPDGISFLFTSAVYPECGADNDCNKTIKRDAESGPLKAHLADHLLFRHWNSWSEMKRTHVFRGEVATGAVVDLTPGDFDSPAFSTGGGGYDVSPDGKEICVASNRDSNEAETTNKDLWLIPVAGGSPVNITDANEAYDGNPAYSPDGKFIAYRTQAIPAYEADRFRIALYERSTGRSRILTDGFDNWVNDIRWSPDSRALYFTADVKGHVPLYRLEIPSGAIAQVVDASTIDQFAFTPNGRGVYLIRRSVGEPRELWSADISGKNLQRVTTFNKSVEDSVDIRPAEEIWIPSPTGKLIHTFIVKPHGFDPGKKYPLILNVHGGPQTQWADAFRGDWQVYPGAGYIVAFPNPHGSTGYGQEFTAAISKDWGGKVYADVMAVADSLSRLPWVDAERMGAMGWSYGGYMMMWMEGHTTRFKALAAMMGLYNLKAFHGATEELWFPEWDLGGVPWESDLYEQWSPNLHVKNFATPCLIITGQRDFRVPYTQSLEFFTDLQRRRVPSRLIVFENDGHWPSHLKSMPLYYNAHLEWFEKYLGGGKAPYNSEESVKRGRMTK
jgi:dipeptidyl aminopeptidase/acylaminoacyl peptidase